MAIQDDFTIDVVNSKITYTTAFVDDRPPTIYTVNELYSYLQDTFDEPGYLQYETPMSAQTPTQYTLINGWFMDNESMKALYGGSIQTSGWTKSGAAGITQVRWQDGYTTEPDISDIGETWTGGSSSATGVVLAIDLVRQVAWLRNTSSAQFSDNEEITGPGSDPQFQTEVNRGVLSGESIWSNLFSVGSLQTQTEIYVGQEDDYMGGTAFHGADAEARLARRIEKIDEWWDSDVDFATGSPNLLGGAGHFDVLIKTTEAGLTIDGGRLFAGARQFSTIYSHFELVGGAQNLVVPFASTGSDLNAQDGPYTAAFGSNTGTIVVGDVLENDTGTSPVGRLRAVVTGGTNLSSATGTIEYYLIGENEPLIGTDRTLKQFEVSDNVAVRDGAVTFDITGSIGEVTNGPAQSQGVTITFANAQRDVNEDSVDEEYACVIDCNSIPLASVYKYVQFLTSRGNQDGTTPDTQDLLLPSGGTDEAAEFYRAVGDITVPWNSRTGTAPAEGSLVTNANSSWTASGIVVSLSDPTGSSGQLVLTQVKGTWANGNTVANVGSHGSNEVTINGTPGVIADNTAAAFGTFAGGRWFVARGVVLDNVPTADANNWQTTDLGGTVRIPPTVRTITFAGLAANDRAALFEVGTAGGVDIVKSQEGQSVGAAGASVGDTTIPIENSVALDVPATGWIRILDVSSTTGQEYRYAYSAVSGTTVTLDSGGNFSGTTTGSESATVLTDTGAFASFGAAGQLRVGMLIRNTTLSEWATILRKIDDDSIETTPLSGGGNWHSGGTADSWIANDVVVALVDADTLYFPFIDDTATTTSISKLIKFVHVTECIARMRFSDPDVGGTRILPFVQKSIQITDADLTVTAIRTTDTIASP